MKKGIWVAIAVAIGVVVYYLFDPSNNQIFPKCPFLVLTELKCPGCGSQRAIHSLLHMDFARAFGYNALLVLSLPIVALLLWAELRRNRNNAFYAKLHNHKFIWGYFAAVILWWIARNIFDL